jgi:hypothetical protein
MYESHRDIIDAWPSLQEYAADLGILFNTARGMRQRSSIHFTYWDDVTAAAKRRKIKGINQKILRQLALIRRGRKNPTSALHVA